MGIPAAIGVNVKLQQCTNFIDKIDIWKTVTLVGIL